MHTASFRIAHQREHVTPNQTEQGRFDKRYTELVTSIRDAQGNTPRLEQLRKDVKQLNVSLARGIRKKVASRINMLYTSIARAKPDYQTHCGGAAGRRSNPKDRQQAISTKRALKEAARAPQTWQADPNNDTVVIRKQATTAHDLATPGLTKTERAHLDHLAESYERCSTWIEGMSERIEEYMDDYGEEYLFNADGSWLASLYLAVEARFVQDDEISRAAFRAELRQGVQVYTDFLGEISSDSSRQLRQDAELVLDMLQALERLPNTQWDAGSPISSNDSLYSGESEELDLDEFYAEREDWVEGMRGFLDAIPQVKLAAGHWSSSLYWEVEKSLLQDVDMSPEAFRADLEWQIEELEELFELLEPEEKAGLRARAEPLIEMHRALLQLPEVPFYKKV